MARIRSIKPELRTSITVSLWPREVRYFFILLWGYLDDYGRGVDDELLIASDCFPRDRDVTPEIVDGWLETMAEAGPVCRYEVDGRNYLHAPNWREHQKPSHPTRSKIPPCPDDEPDDFKRWREAHPQRLTRRSRKSRESLGKIPEVRDEPSGSLSGGPSEDLETGHVHGDLEPGLVERHDEEGDEETAGQRGIEAVPETLANSSGDAPEHFVPEQGSKGAREQGSKGARGCGGEARQQSPSDLVAADQRPDGLHSIPDDFHLNDTMRRWVVGTYGQLLNPEFETEQFISYWRAEGRKKRNWHDAWQKWIRDSGQKASERAQRYLPVAAGAENVLHLADRRPSTADQRATAALAIAAELAAEENQ
ncbi:hypothetical protein ACIQVR_39380 [Streptomyces xanthochromogenes]|uniref:hypothetical protein n=1 Tax=Streptomyces xanthochromogenes TaxID=67384 RepID=UPI003826C41E